MGAPLNNNNSNKKFQKGNTAASAKKGRKHIKTLVRERMGLVWADAEALVEENIMAMLKSKSPKIRNAATKNFAEFIKPKKREIQKDYDEDRLIVNVIYGNPTEANAKNHPTA